MKIQRFLPDIRETPSVDAMFPGSFFEQRPLPAFTEKNIDFLNGVSQSLLSAGRKHGLPDIVALGYWLRKAHLSQITRQYLGTLDSSELPIPRGTAFHVAPSNVDVIFTYSWALSVLSGNLNIVRISQEQSQQMLTILDSIREVIGLSQWIDIAARNAVITYPHDDESNKYLSANADVRILWGGDNTINSFRALQVKSTVVDVAFADRKSVAVISAREFLANSIS